MCLPVFSFSNINELHIGVGGGYIHIDDVMTHTPHKIIETIETPYNQKNERRHIFFLVTGIMII